MKKTCARMAPCKIASSERHNQRLKSLSYVRAELSNRNESKINESIASRLKQIEARYREVTGQRLQPGAEPIQEIVLVGATSIDQAIKFGELCRQEFGIVPFQWYIHADEGHWQDGQWKPNLHAHIVFDCTQQDHQLVLRDTKSHGRNLKDADGNQIKKWVDGYGKTIKLNRSQMARMQDLAAMATGLQRGNPSSKVGLDAITFKVKQQENEYKNLRKENKGLKEINENLKTENIDLVIENNGLKDHIAKLTTANKKLEAENEELKSQQTNLNKDLSIAEKRVKGLLTMIANLESRRKEVEEQIDTAKKIGDKSLATLQVQLDQINRSIKDKTDKLIDAEEKLKIVQIKTKTKQIEHDEIQKAISELPDAKQELNTVHNRIKRFNLMIDDLEAEHKKLTKNVESLRDILKTTRSKDDTLSFEIIRKREELDEYERNLAKIEATLADKREKLEQATEDLNKMISKVTEQAEKYVQLKDATRILGTEFNSKNTDTIKQFAKASICDVVMYSFSRIFQSMDDTTRQQFADSDIQNVLDSGKKVVSVASMLFLGMVGAAMEATQAASTAGGGGGCGGSDLPWDGRRDDENDTKFMQRCVSHAAKLCSRSRGASIAPSQAPGQGGGRRRR